MLLIKPSKSAVRLTDGSLIRTPAGSEFLRVTSADTTLPRSMPRVSQSFFGHLKEELFHHATFTSVDTFTTALDEYLTWYNTDRISTKLKGLTPVQYRDQALAA